MEKSFKQKINFEYLKATSRLSQLKAVMSHLPNGIGYLEELPKAMEKFQFAIRPCLEAYLEKHKNQHQEVFNFLKEYDAVFFKRFGVPPNKS